jgi:hypothetical protein
MFCVLKNLLFGRKHSQVIEIPPKNAGASNGVMYLADSRRRREERLRGKKVNQDMQHADMQKDVVLEIITQQPPASASSGNRSA